MVLQRALSIVFDRKLSAALAHNSTGFRGVHDDKFILVQTLEMKNVHQIKDAAFARLSDDRDCWLQSRWKLPVNFFKRPIRRENTPPTQAMKKLIRQSDSGGSVGCF
jgi:hypothetical protein